MCVKLMRFALCLACQMCTGRGQSCLCQQSSSALFWLLYLLKNFFNIFNCKSLQDKHASIGSMTEAASQGKMGQFWLVGT